ncbi:MAG: response regulator [Candidatus Binataceae bacterium]
MTVKALIIDDSPFARRVIRHHLTNFGFRVIGEAENAAQALELLREFKPELVTLDVMMPEVGGYDSLRLFREMRLAIAGLAVVVVSAVPFGKIRDSFLAEGAVAYVVKPFNRFSFEPARQKLMRIFRQSAA